MSKRKSQRMFSREQRRAARAATLEAAAGVTQEELDTAAIVAIYSQVPATLRLTAQWWLDLSDEAWDNDEREVAARDALGRRLERGLGVKPTVELVESAIEAADELRDIDAEFRRTDDEWAERILDAEMAAAELDEEE